LISILIQNIYVMIKFFKRCALCRAVLLTIFVVLFLRFLIGGNNSTYEQQETQIQTDSKAFPSQLPELQAVKRTDPLIVTSPCPSTSSYPAVSTSVADLPKEISSARNNNSPVYIVMSWCGITSLDSPAAVSFKSILLSDGQHGSWEEGAAPLAFIIMTDRSTHNRWLARDDYFREIRTVMERHPKRYSIKFILEDDMDMLIKSVLDSEAQSTSEAATNSRARFLASVNSLDINMFARCSGMRLLAPLLFHDLQHYIYLDFDTITLCDIRRLHALVFSYSPSQAIGLALEDPTRGKWKLSWYTEHNLNVAVPGGFNAGVMLVHVENLRAGFGGKLSGYWDFVNEIIKLNVFQNEVVKTSAYCCDLGDQDVLNVFLRRRPDLAFVLPTRWSTMQPGIRLWPEEPEYIPDPPCLIHYNANGFASEPSQYRIGNAAYRFFREWQMSSPTEIVSVSNLAVNKPLQESETLARALLSRTHATLDAIASAANNNMGRSNNVAEQTLALFDLILSNVRSQHMLLTGGLTFCEIGFNVGHSATTFLAGATAAGANISRFIAFDKVESISVEQGFTAVKAAFPSTSFELVKGASENTVVPWAAERPNFICDVAHIDGAHAGGGPLRDWNALQPLFRRDGFSIVVFDDCHCGGQVEWWCLEPTSTWDDIVARGLAIKIADLSFPGSKGSCAGWVRPFLIT
jgi:lipopolysaccharide biosynthesis glycosyltransferase